MNKICLILACVCFAIGAIQKLAGSEVNWTNGGLAFLTLALILG